MNQISPHLVGTERIQQTQHTGQEGAVLAAPELAGNDDAAMGVACCGPLVVEGSKVTDVEGQNGAILIRGEQELSFVGGGVHPCLLGRQRIVPLPAQIRRQLRLDVPVEVEANEQRFRTG